MPTNISSIGATGRTYSTVLSWEAATDNDLVAAGDIEVGEMYDDSDFTEININISGAITDASNYRILKAASGEEYNPSTGAGVWWTHTGTSSRLFNIGEAYAQVGPGMGLHLAKTNAGFSRVCYLEGDNSLLERCYIRTESVIGSVEGTNLFAPATIRNCIFDTAGGSGTGTEYGIRVTGLGALESCNIYNNAIYANGGGSALQTVGIDMTSGASLNVNNNIVIGFTTNDYNWSASSYTSRDYNAAGDLTGYNVTWAPNGLNGQVATSIWTDPANDDFTLKTGSNAIDAGTDLSGTFTDDFDGTTRSGTWDMGAYNSGAAPSIPPGKFLRRYEHTPAPNVLLRM